MQQIERSSTDSEQARPEWLPSEEFPFESRFLELDGHRIHYVDEGAGPTLLFVHAGPAWSFVFGRLVERLLGEFRCVALDFPGSGLSRASEGYRPGIQAAAKVLESFVVAMDLREVTLVVNDLGGPVAFGVAARHPQRFGAMALLETFGWPLSEENPRVVRMLNVVGSNVFQALNGATNLLHRATSTSLGVGRHLSPRGRAAFRGPYRDRSLRRNALLMLGDAASAGTQAYLRDVDRALRTALSDRALLLVFGSRSPTVRERFPEKWLERFPTAELLMVEGGHHFPHMDDPVLVAATISSWYRRINPLP